jgi:hypothetical protein
MPATPLKVQGKNEQRAPPFSNITASAQRILVANLPSIHQCIDLVLPPVQELLHVVGGVGCGSDLVDNQYVLVTQAVMQLTVFSALLTR